MNDFKSYKSAIVILLFFISNFFSYAYAEKNNELSNMSNTYKHLLIIYPNINVDYIKYVGGIPKNFADSMSENLKSVVIDAYKNLPNLIIDGSNGQINSICDVVEISRPIDKLTKITEYDGKNFYWLSNFDISNDLAIYAPPGKYDSVHVVWYNGSDQDEINSYWGLGGVFINDESTTFSSLISGMDWWWNGIGEAFGEPFLHEWLHGVCNYYKNFYGYKMPQFDADGAEVHGYSKSQTDGWMQYYRDLMRGLVWDLSLSQYTGITLEAWSMKTPREKIVGYVDEEPFDYDTKIIVLTNAEPNIQISSNIEATVYGSSTNNHILLESGAKAKLYNCLANNVITIEADSTQFTVRRSGANVIFQGSENTILQIPATASPQTIVFNDASLDLVIKSGLVMLEDQIVDLNSDVIY